ncbi:FecR domain-containing protein [Olivibacter sp. SDN3]|uniref:FecR family protein n=1 Tax=Olivibacter sp. SDN3 TaxID=2764720 RepID=UPI00165188E9|nr:FecR domain-containing protein [Olivibacter sp. SDN3]QNL49139.1 FecR domain-containing protein [Olivibacter sp. SDN3]
MYKKEEDILVEDDHKKILSKEDSQVKRTTAWRILRFLKLSRPASLTLNDRDVLWQRIQASTGTDQISMRRRPKRLYLKVAACAASIILAVLIYTTNRSRSNLNLEHIAIKNQTIAVDTTAIGLLAEDGTFTKLHEQKELVVDNKADNGKSSFQTLNVPYGRSISLRLPDDSKVTLNAGSQLTFPTNFSNESRTVYLEGEAFFDIATDEKHPFIVRTEDIKIRVLGTKFNVSAYKDESASTAILLSGKIELSDTKSSERFQKQQLVPGDVAVLDRKIDKLNISLDKSNHEVLWTGRKLKLYNTPHLEVLKKLERRYNVKILDVEAETREETFSGTLDLNNSLLNVLHTVYDSQYYYITQQGRRVVVQKKKASN